MPCAAATALPSSTSPRDERAQVGPLADAAVREPGERADRIRRRVEDHLAPLRPARVARPRASACRRACTRRRAARPPRTAPVAPRTARASCRPSRPTARAPGSTIFPAGNVVPRITRSTWPASTSSLPSPFCTVATEPLANACAVARDRSLGVHRLRRDDAEVARRELRRVGRRAQPADDVARAGEPQPVRVDRVDVLARERRTPRPRRRRAARGSRRTASRRRRSRRCRSSRVARLLRLDQPIERGVQRHRDAEPVAPRARARRVISSISVGRCASTSSSIDGRVRVAALGREHVHLPRVLPELDAGGAARRPCPRRRGRARGRGRRAALSAKWKSCGSPVSAATALTVALKISFDHCAGRRSSNASAFRPDDDDEVGDRVRVGRRRVAVRADPGRGVEDVLDVRVAVARAAHERDGREQRPVAVRADDLLGAEAVLDRHHRRARRSARRGARASGVEVAALAREDHEVGVGAPPGRATRVTRAVKSARPETRSPCSFERARVLLAPREHRDVRDAREVRGEQAADRRRRPRRRRGSSRRSHPSRELAPAGEPARPQDEDERHQRADDDEPRARRQVERAAEERRRRSRRRARNESSALTASAPTTAPQRLVDAADDEHRERDERQVEIDATRCSPAAGARRGRLRSPASAPESTNATEPLPVDGDADGRRGSSVLARRAQQPPEAAALVGERDARSRAARRSPPASSPVVSGTDENVFSPGPIFS